MPYTLGYKDGYIHIEWHGEFSAQDLAQLRQDMPKHAIKFIWTRRVLHTFDGVTSCSLKPMEALDHSVKRKRFAIPIKARAASVAKTEEVYKFAKLMQELNRNTNLAMEIFPDEQSAIAWLKE